MTPPTAPVSLSLGLLNFQGTLIVVSHDRDFLQGVTNVVYEFKDSTIRQYLGDIDYFLEQRNISHLRDAERRTVPDKLSKQKPASTQHDPDRQKELKFLQNRLSKLEVKVSKVEKELKDMDKALALNYEKTTADGDFYKKYESKKTSLKDLMGQWEEASLKLEKHSRI